MGHPHARCDRDPKKSIPCRGKFVRRIDRAESKAIHERTGRMTMSHPDMNKTERIMVDPAICNGRPIVKGTRITVQSVLEYLAAGDSIEDILEEFPRLERTDIVACLTYA
jgi:uncharacterized protein (DUF433 family)